MVWRNAGSILFLNRCFTNTRKRSKPSHNPPQLRLSKTLKLFALKIVWCLPKNKMFSITHFIIVINSCCSIFRTRSHFQFKVGKLIHDCWMIGPESFLASMRVNFGQPDKKNLSGFDLLITKQYTKRESFDFLQTHTQHFVPVKTLKKEKLFKERRSQIRLSAQSTSNHWTSITTFSSPAALWWLWWFDDGDDLWWLWWFDDSTLLFRFFAAFYVFRFFAAFYVPRTLQNPYLNNAKANKRCTECEQLVQWFLTWGPCCDLNGPRMWFKGLIGFAMTSGEG